MTHKITQQAPWLASTLNTGDSNFLEQANLTQKITKEPIKANDQIIPGVKALMRLSDKTFYRVVPDDFEVLQPEEFFQLTTQVGGLVHSAGQTDDGEIVYFTTIPEEQYQTFQVNNDIYQNFILFALSYNADIGIAILPISVNISRNLTFNVAEMLQTPRPRIRQSKNVKARAKDPQEFKEIYNDAVRQLNKFKETLQRASNTNGYSLPDVLENLLPIPPKATDNKITRTLSLREEISNNHISLYGTSLYSIFQAIYATDIERHDRRRITLARRFFTGKTSPLAVQAINLAQDNKKVA